MIDRITGDSKLIYRYLEEGNQVVWCPHIVNEYLTESCMNI